MSEGMKKPQGERRLNHLIGGAVSASTANLLLQPFDVLRTTLIGRPTTGSAAQRTSIYQIVRGVVSEEGVAGLWRGSVPTFWRVAPGGGLYFVSLHEMTQAVNVVKKRTHHSERTLTAFEGLCVGGLARGFVAIVTCPVVVVKTRFEYEGAKQSFLSTLTNIAKTEGSKGLFSGVVPSVLRDAPYSGVYLAIYSSIKTAMFVAAPERQASDASVTMAAGSISGALATAATHPFDVIRTRLQLQSINSGKAPTSLTSPPQVEYAGVRDCMAKIARDEGSQAFFKGLVPRLVKKSVSSAITWTVYEQTVLFLRRARKPKTAEGSV